jgi:transposase
VREITRISAWGVHRSNPTDRPTTTPYQLANLAKTVRTCSNLLNVEVAMWLFIREEDVEQTNNAAERAIRPSVIWRRTNFGSDSTSGSEFVSRLLTVMSSLNLQKRNILEFLSESVEAKRSVQRPLSLIP